MNIKQTLCNINRNFFSSLTPPMEIEYLVGFEIDYSKIKENKQYILINDQYFFHIQGKEIVHNCKCIKKIQDYQYKYIEKKSIEMLKEFIQQNKQPIQKYPYKTDIKVIDNKEIYEVPFQPTKLNYVRYIDKVQNPSTDYNQEHLIEFFGEMNGKDFHFGVQQQPNTDQLQNSKDLHILTKFNNDKFHSFEGSKEEFHLQQFYPRVWNVQKEFKYDNGVKILQSAAYKQDGTIDFIPSNKIKGFQLQTNVEQKPQDLEYWNKYDQSFCKNDFQALLPGRWISSTIIDAYATRLEQEQLQKIKKNLQANSSSKLYAIIKSTFYTNIQGSDDDLLIGYQYFPKQKYGLGIENIYSRIFIIINKNNTHWYLMELSIQGEQLNFLVYDSMQRNSKSYEKEVFDMWRVLMNKQLVLTHYKQPLVKLIQTPQQKDGYSCGDHTAVKLRLAFEDKKFDDPLYNQYLSEMRDIMKQTINYQ